jgi:hypothetical protein
MQPSCRIDTEKRRRFRNTLAYFAAQSSTWPKSRQTVSNPISATKWGSVRMGGYTPGTPEFALSTLDSHLGEIASIEAGSKRNLENEACRV